ncbi:MAG TPA: hypothetical protein VE465_05170 [Streptosporangiaceae bacterium]|jgi:hypothetical protein|nr:hypothetical protein [Streptosporangiaceae bacterium]
MRRVLMLVGPTVLAVGLIVPGSAAGSPPDPAAQPPVSSCSGMCPMIYEPVVCELSDGVTRSFSNDCVARAYACDRALHIVGCAAGQIATPR